VKEEGDRELTAFVTGNGIRHVTIPMKGTKKEAIPDVIMKDILSHILDRRNYPLMLHCNHGKHRTGCVVGVMRKLAGWDVGRTVDEYRSFAEPKIREVDVAYISAFEASSLGLVGKPLMHRPLTPAQKHARTRSLCLAFAFWAILCVIFWFFHTPKPTA
jgi:tyrosine-protein phosphatase SIW14